MLYTHVRTKLPLEMSYQGFARCGGPTIHDHQLVVIDFAIAHDDAITGTTGIANSKKLNFAIHGPGLLQLR
ncbi:MAG: hypothetical protein A2Z93_01720 [Curvibacter sp. GWA2_64_110]|nr:MAG: hypothetical protein A2Z93_01720 [Curvibacter sp. GWA2_64_110]